MLRRLHGSPIAFPIAACSLCSDEDDATSAGSAGVRGSCAPAVSPGACFREAPDDRAVRSLGSLAVTRKLM